jgi:hypothetical protein
VGPNFVGFHANKGILAHPQNLLPQGGKAIKAIGIEGEIDRDDVRAVVARASQPAKADTREELSAFFASHFRDQHSVPPAMPGE